MYSCALCSVHVCSSGDFDKAPQNCPCTNERMKEIKELYTQEDIYKTAHLSSLITSQGYCKNTRLEEIMDFANSCGYKNIGLAFCIGLANEAKMLSKILSYNGFEVNSVTCKIGNIPKNFIDVIEPEKVAMCNPIGQAMFLNEAKTDLNILLGLCVGHDSLFIKYSEALVTVFAVKDRVLGHNPLAAIYQSESYYKDKLFPERINK
ncbi:MAG: DUF1847 domain-containing protein [Bacillota bacterium]